MEYGTLDVLTLFVILAGLFIFVNNYFLKLPSSIGLMIMALMLSFVIIGTGLLIPAFQLETMRILEDFEYREVIFEIILTFLLFAGALKIDFRTLAEEKGPVLILATFGVIISTIVTGTAIYYLLNFIGLHLDYIYCLAFGALISPTDPIAVISTLKRYNVSEQLRIRIEGEALFNDGISVVFALALLDLETKELDHYIHFADLFTTFTVDIVGGVLIGLMLGYVCFKLLDYIPNDQSELEILVTLALLMASTQFAHFEAIEVSGKQAAVVMGLVVGNEGKSDKLVGAASDYVFKFWFLIEQSLNAILYVLIGIEMLIIPLQVNYFAAGFFAFAIVLFARWLSVFTPIKFMSVKRYFDPSTVSIMTWGSLRGGVPIAMSLTLPDFEGRDLVITMTYIVVVVSILYQGLSVNKMLKTTVGYRPVEKED